MRWERVGLFKFAVWVDLKARKGFGIKGSSDKPLKSVQGNLTMQNRRKHWKYLASVNRKRNGDD